MDPEADESRVGWKNLEAQTSSTTRRPQDQSRKPASSCPGREDAHPRALDAPAETGEAEPERRSPERLRGEELARQQLEQMFQCIVESGESKMRRRTAVSPKRPAQSPAETSEPRMVLDTNDGPGLERSLRGSARRAAAARWLKSEACSTLLVEELRDEPADDDSGRDVEEAAASQSSEISFGLCQRPSSGLEFSDNNNEQQHELNSAPGIGKVALERRLEAAAESPVSDCHGRKSEAAAEWAGGGMGARRASGGETTRTNMTNRQQQWLRVGPSERPIRLAGGGGRDNKAAARSRTNSGWAEMRARRQSLGAPVASNLAKSGADESELEREDGPTPTNDLVRGLLQRDRQAWAPKSAARLDTFESQIRGEARCDCGRRGASLAAETIVCAAHCLDARRPLEAGTQDAPSVVRDRNFKMRISDEHNDSEDNEEGPQQSARFKCPAGSDAPSEPVDDQLSRLISAKCQLGADGGPSAAGSAAGSKESGEARRRPSLSPYRIAARAIESMQLAAADQRRRRQEPAGGGGLESDFGPRADDRRRHSNYMLPQLLLERAMAAAAASSSGQSSSSSASDVSGSEEAEELRLAVNCSPARSEDDERAPIAGHLPSSASSPSALSTPTNDLAGSARHLNAAVRCWPRGRSSKPARRQDEEPAGGRGSGCGGSCCSARSQLLKLAAENALARSQLPAGRSEDVARRLSASSKGGPPVELETSARQPSGRRRLGSNPFERLRRASGHTLALAMRSSNSEQRRRGKAPGQEPRPVAKRHSIMNLLSGGGERSLARPLQPAATGGARRPSEAGLDEQQQQEPLIPESGFKIVVMGNSGSGKTSIIQQFLYGTFSHRHQPTVEDTYFIEFPYRKNTINISVSDTSGTYQFPAMKKLAINSGDAFILVYSVDDPQSFDDLEQLREAILCERERAYLEATNSSASMISNDSAAVLSSSSSSSIHHQHQLNNNTSPNGQPALVFQSSSTPCTEGAGSLVCSAAPGGQQVAPDSSPSRQNHRSLASFIGHYTHLHLQSRHAKQPAQGNLQPSNQQQQFEQQSQAACGGHSSLGSSICSSSNSCSSSAENSRRSSISAAEAALRTRRTRRPPMVIVANKYDLPKERHLVNSDEIEAVVIIDWNNGFVRTSAAFNWNVDEIFQQVLKQAKQPLTLTEAIVSKRRKSLPPKLPQHP